MQILPSTLADFDRIFTLYDDVMAYQKTKFYRYWLGFNSEMTKKEIAETRHWKIMVNDTIVCVFSLTYNDPDIWFERDAEPSLYIHRIAVNPAFSGNGYVRNIITWAKQYAKQVGKKYIRIDTFGDNTKLINYYTSLGFTWLENRAPLIHETSPKHYVGVELALLEMPVD